MRAFSRLVLFSSLTLCLGTAAALAQSSSSSSSVSSSATSSSAAFSSVSSVNACVDAEKSNAKVRASCQDGKVTERKIGACVWLRCDAAPATRSPNACAKAEQANKGVMESCKTGKIMKVLDSAGCPWAKCVSENADKPAKNSCAQFKEGNEKAEKMCPDTKMKVMMGECAVLKCPATGTPSPTAPGKPSFEQCEKMWTEIEKTTNADKKELMTKDWKLKCLTATQTTEPKKNMEKKPVACKKAVDGCSIMCEDGTNYNVCNK